MNMHAMIQVGSLMNRTSNVIVFPTRRFTTAGSSTRDSETHNNYIEMRLIISIMVNPHRYYNYS